MASSNDLRQVYCCGMRDKERQLEQVIKTSHDEAVKATNALWRSRIQRINAVERLRVEYEKLEEILDVPISKAVKDDICGVQARINDLKKELEGLLKDV